MDNLTNLKFWCYKVLPLVYDNSLSYYEVLCKVVTKVNEVITNMNNIPDEIAKSYKDTSAINSVLQKIFIDLKNSITEHNEGESITATNNYNAGDIIWQNDTLYRVLKNITTGDKWVLNANYAKVTIDEMIKTVYKPDEKTLYIRGIVNGTVQQPIAAKTIGGEEK